MSTLTLKVEADTGADIHSAFRKAIHIAKKLDVTVEFTFNDVTCFATKLSKVSIGVEKYHQAINTGAPYATSYHPVVNAWFQKKWGYWIILFALFVWIINFILSMYEG